jgi:hypothetical protein
MGLSALLGSLQSQRQASRDASYSLFGFQPGTPGATRQPAVGQHSQQQQLHGHPLLMQTLTPPGGGRADHGSQQQGAVGENSSTGISWTSSVAHGGGNVSRQPAVSNSGLTVERSSFFHQKIILNYYL